MIEIRKTEPTEKDCRELGEFLLGQMRESAVAVPNVEKAMRNGYNYVLEDMSFEARLDGRIVGALALIEKEFWYSDETYLQNTWLFVDPGQRFGLVGVRLLQEARRVADARDLICFVLINTPGRRSKATASTLYQQVAGYVPLGHVVALRSARAGGRVPTEGITRGSA